MIPSSMMGDRAMSTRNKKVTAGDQKDIFQPIVESIFHIIGLPVSVWTPDKKGKTLTITASVGLPKDYTKTVYLDLDKPSVGGDAFKNKKIQKVLDINAEPRWKYKKSSKEMNWKSAICVPIVVDNIAVGVIDVYGYTKRSIIDVAQILPDFAKQISLTLETAKQTEIRQRILDIASKLQTVAENPKIVLDEIVKGACELTGANSAVVYPFDFEKGEFYEVENVVAYGLMKPLIIPQKPRVEGGMAAHVMENGEVVVENLAKQGSANYAKSIFIRKEGVQAFIGIALKESENILGVLYVNFHDPHFFTRQEKETIRLFAHQASTALNNSRLYQRARQDAKILSKLQEIGIDLMSLTGTSRSLRSILERIAQSAKDILDADLVDLYQYNQIHDVFIVPPIRIGKIYDPTIHKVMIHKDDVVYSIVKRRKPKYTLNAQADHALKLPFRARPGTPKTRFVVRENISSMAAVPLMAGTEVVGVLFVNFRKHQAFSLEQKSIIELFANQAAVVIRKARLFEQRNTLQKIAQDVTHVHDKDELLQKILVRSLDLLGCEAGSICLLDKPTNRLEFQYAINKKKYLSVTVGEGLIGTAAKEMRPIRVGDVANDLRYVKHVGATRSELDVPMLIGDELIGVLNAESKRNNAFDEDAEELAVALAGHAAVAIQNATLLQRRQALTEFGQAVTSGIRLHENKILDLIYKQANKLMDTGNLYIALYDDTTDIVRFGLAYQKGKRIDVNKEAGWEPRKAGKGRTEEIIQTKKSIFNATKAEAEEWYKQPGREEYIGTALASWIGVPMMVADRAIGVIATYHPDQDFVYNQDDLEILQAIANQAAIALDNSRLYYDITGRREALVEFGQAMTSGIRLHENKILDLIYKQASKLMETGNLYIALYDDTTDIVRFGLAYQKGKRIDVNKEAGWESRKAGKGKTEEIIQTKKPIFNATKTEAEEWYKQSGREEYIGTIFPSWVGVPMMVADKAIGVIATYHPDQDFVYDQDDLEILQAIANQAAVALENSALYQNVQKRREQLERVRKVANAITRELDSQICMNIILEETMKLLGAGFATIQLVDKASNELVIQAQNGVEGRKLPPEMERIKFGMGITGKAMQERKIIRVGNIHEMDGYLGYIKDSVSEMAAPLFEQGEVVGVLNVEDVSLNAFNEDDEELFKLLAEQVVIAIQNARKVEEKEALARLEYLGILAGGVAHRLGSRGGLIRLHVNQIRELLPIKELKKALPTTADETCTLLDNIEKNNEYLLELSEALFKPASASETPLGSVNVNQLLQQAIRRANIPSEVRLSVAKGKIPLVVGNKWLIEVFIELITNAVKAMTKSKIKELNISTQLADERHVSIFVTDTGIGISKAEIDKVFNLFYTHTDDADSGKHGFGLWYCKAIVNRMGGDLELVSKLGAGTTFSILLPLAKKARLA
jgi:GAF domain-containing protein